MSVVPVVDGRAWVDAGTRRRQPAAASTAACGAPPARSSRYDPEGAATALRRCQRGESGIVDTGDAADGGDELAPGAALRIEHLAPAGVSL